MLFRQLFDRTSCTYTYLLADPDSGEAVLIDPVRELVDRDAELLEQLGLRLVATLETHVHADHVTGASALRERLGSQVIVPANAGVRGADRGVGAGDTVAFGPYALHVRPTPGHTESCTSYVLLDPPMAFTGDALFIRGCGRTDFQGGDPSTLYRSVHTQILSLPPDARIYPGHDYKGRTVSTVAEERAHNPRLGGGRTIDDFVEIMAALNLAHPALMHVAVPANLRAGVGE
jgi:glyoxylase-like metal-dependent hydrolase (beta-lactamase superfamily II)